jgi:DNA-binding PadR family transcriptional regulator
VDLGTYREIEGLFHYKWDAAILDVLAEEPRRYLALARRVQTTVHPNLSEGEVTRTLSRLGKLGVIRKTSRTDGRPCEVYELTEKGHQTLAAYHAIIAAYRPPTATASPDA